MRIFATYENESSNSSWEHFYSQNQTLKIFPKFKYIEGLNNVFTFFGQDMDNKIETIFPKENYLQYSYICGDYRTFVLNLPHKNSKLKLQQKPRETLTPIEIEDWVKYKIREVDPKDVTCLGLSSLLVKTKQDTSEKIVSRTGVIKAGEEYFIIRRNVASGSTHAQHFRFFRMPKTFPYVFLNCLPKNQISFWIHADKNKYFNFEYNMETKNEEYYLTKTFQRETPPHSVMFTFEQSFNITPSLLEQSTNENETHNIMEKENENNNFQKKEETSYSRKHSQDETVSSTPRSSSGEGKLQPIKNNIQIEITKMKQENSKQHKSYRKSLSEIEEKEAEKKKPKREATD
jgi:hypothetical protein